MGGGQSLQTVDIPRLRGRIIAINEAYAIRPDADILYFADARWWQTRKQQVREVWRGKHIVTRSSIKGEGIINVRHNCTIACGEDMRLLAGWDSGTNALNLAYLLGADPIILVGYDMIPGRWHENYDKPTNPIVYTRRFQPSVEKLGRAIEKKGVRVVNVSKRTRLQGFEYADWESFCD